MNNQYLSLFQQASLFGQSATVDPNALVDAAVTHTLTSIDRVLHDIQVLELYIKLTIPKMEDGNNFGVTVQLAALKEMDTLKETLEKATEDLSKYSAARADVLEKCKMPTSVVVLTDSQSKSDSETTGGEKPGKTSTTTSSSDEKKTKTATEIPEKVFRERAVGECDALYYAKAKAAFVKTSTGYAAIMDFCSKNTEKLDKPKGTTGATGYSSMY